MSAHARHAVAIDVTPLLGLRTGIGVAVAEILAALQKLDAAPDLVPYTLSLRARQHRADVPADTRFVPIPARVLLPAWGRFDAPRIDHWIRPARVVHTTNYLTPPSTLPTMVSVYDCSFVRYPELCSPEVRAFVPIVRRAVARGATVHTTSEFVAGEIEEIFGPGLRRTGRLVVIPLGVPSIGTDARMPTAVAAKLAGAPYVLAIGTLEPRKNLAHLVAAFGTIAATHPDLHLVIAGQDGPARPDVDAAVGRLDADAAARVLLPGPVTDAGRRALLDSATMLAYPSIYEGFGFPVLEAMSVGLPVVAARAGSIPEVAGDAALLVEPTDESQLADAITRVLTDDTARHELIARGRDRVRAFSWEDTALALASCYRRLADGRRALMRIACHAGQLLQPVPGGIGRYVRELLARLPEAGVEPIAFAAGPRPRNVPARVPWIDLGRPSGSVRYELWHRTRHPVVRLDVDVVHAPSLAIPPVRGAPLAVTVHDIAFIRFPRGTTRRGIAFHQRGFDLARREASLVLTPSAFTRVELIREGFEPEGVVLAPLGVNRPVPRDPDEIDTTVARTGVRSPFLLTVGTVEPRKDLPTIVEALQRMRRSQPDLELVVVGPSGWGDVTGLDRPGVRVLGPQPWRVVDALYRRTACCCIASRYEGFGLPALEALARGAPVVAADDSALTEVVGEAGLLFPPGDVDALTRDLERVRDDDDLRAQLQRRGPVRAAALTWEASAAAHVDAFRLAATRHRQRA